MCRGQGIRLVFLCLTVQFSVLFYLFSVHYRKFVRSQHPLIKRPDSCASDDLLLESQNQVLPVRVPRRPVVEPSPQTRTILLWTTFFREPYTSNYYFLQANDTTFLYYHCPVANCRVTRNKSAILDVDAVLFHMFDITRLPTERLPHQKWILYNMEAPTNTYKLSRSLNGVFNWTMSYALNSDIVSRYGVTCLRDEHPSEISDRDMDYHGSKAKEILWFVSNCHTSSRRENYVKELKKYIPVDMIGACSNVSCLPKLSLECLNYFLPKYKFYLAFENSICKDYVSEKFFNTMLFDVVPVVWGGAEYDRYLPKGAYVNAVDFPRPQDLADHLQFIGSNKELYNSMVRKKRRYSAFLVPWMCELCQKLHSADFHRYSIRRRIFQETFQSSECKVWHKDRFIPLYKMIYRPIKII